MNEERRTERGQTKGKEVGKESKMKEERSMEEK
jgi:hypothetical protein